MRRIFLLRPSFLNCALLPSSVQHVKFWLAVCSEMKWFGFLLSLLVRRLRVDHWGSKCGYNSNVCHISSMYCTICMNTLCDSVPLVHIPPMIAALRGEIWKMVLQLEIWNTESRCMMHFHSACASTIHIHTGHIGVFCMLCYIRFSAVFQLVQEEGAGQRGLKGEKGERVRISS